MDRDGGCKHKRGGRWRERHRYIYRERVIANDWEREGELARGRECIKSLLTKLYHPFRVYKFIPVPFYPLEPWKAYKWPHNRHFGKFTAFASQCSMNLYQLWHHSKLRAVQQLWCWQWIRVTVTTEQYTLFQINWFDQAGHLCSSLPMPTASSNIYSSSNRNL